MSEWPTPVGEQALHGPAGEFVLRTEPHSEAHRATRGRTFTSELRGLEVRLMSSV
jgi:hypothetical protein